MSSVNNIRQSFLDYFVGHGHRKIASAPLVPFNDPTLLFTNAGMVPFKSVFTGQEQRDYNRATSSQKCVRAGGKHNDLDNVGYTARHHTFFEMLGNFSFGDYFKEQAIFYSWDLITRGFGLDKDRLLVTVYSEDEEAASLWKKIAGLSDDRIIRISTSDNFWSMGDTGPCGPCSEIFYDHGSDIPGGPPGSADEDGDRFIEIWNLVFMQYEQIAPGDRVDLPSPSIDTGMGLERIAAVLQGKHNNYEIDTFQKLIQATESVIGRQSSPNTVASYRVIADHLRAASFLIADGVLPSNEGRGYVLRRIMRRAMRHAHLLGAEDPVMYRLFPALQQEMGDAFPELARGKNLITQTLELEENRFRVMLAKGLRLLDDEVSKLGQGQSLPGDIAFKLYDTYGFPLDLTEDAMRSQGRTVDVNDFKVAMQAQRERARSAWTGLGDAATDRLWFDLRHELGSTEFTGYTNDKAEAVITALIKGGKKVSRIEAGETATMLTNQTPFYGESGGQMGDAGVITSFSVADTGKGRIVDTGKVLGALHTHKIHVGEGAFSVGDVVHLVIDQDRRNKLRANHSATHILHAVLRNILGDHVTQKGSLVSPDRLRFDISHPQVISHQERRAVELEVNRVIRFNDEVVTRLMTHADALEAGALALFGEKYGDEVRVLFMGNGLASGPNPHYSVELCGGTHVERLGDIGTFVIIGESAVGSGVRRLEALTGEAAIRYLQDQEDRLQDAASVLKAPSSELKDRVSTLMEERKRLAKDLKEAKMKLAIAGSAQSTNWDENGSNGAAHDRLDHNIKDFRFRGQILDGIASKDLRAISDKACSELERGVVVLIGINDGKASANVAVTPSLTSEYKAPDLIKIVVEKLGGKGGGGRPEMAQGGGPDADNAQNAINALRKHLEDLEEKS